MFRMQSVPALTAPAARRVLIALAIVVMLTAFAGSISFGGSSVPMVAAQTPCGVVANGGFENPTRPPNNSIGGAANWGAARVYQRPDTPRR